MVGGGGQACRPGNWPECGVEVPRGVMVMVKSNFESFNCCDLVDIW